MNTDREAINYTQDSFPYRFLVSPRFRVVRNMVAVLLLAAVSFSQSFNTFGLLSGAIGGSAIRIIAIVNFAGLLAVTYLHIYLLVPRYLLGNRYAAYGLLSLLLILLLTLLKPAEEYAVTQIYGLPAMRSSWLNGVTVLDTLSDFTLYLLCIGGASLAVVLKSWLVGGARKRELENRRLAARVEEVKQEADPQVLLRSLDRAAEFAKDEPSRASEIVMLQSRLLRYRLYDGHGEKVMLGGEMRMIEDYLRLETLCSGDFSYELTVDGDRNRALVPPLLLLSVVQEISRIAGHVALGFSLSPAGDVALRGRAETPCGLPDFSQSEHRLRYIYGDRYVLAVRNEDAGFNVELQIPAS